MSDAGCTIPSPQPAMIHTATASQGRKTDDLLDGRNGAGPGAIVLQVMDEPVFGFFMMSPPREAELAVSREDGACDQLSQKIDGPACPGQRRRRHEPGSQEGATAGVLAKSDQAEATALATSDFASNALQAPQFTNSEQGVL
jgi:hypothetical protein